MSDRESAPANFVLVGVIALVPLLAISTAAPGGEAWRWLEFPRPISVLGLGVAVLLCARGSRAVGWVVLAPVAGALVHEWVEVSGADVAVTIAAALLRAATWLVAAAFALLVRLCATSRRPARAAGLWLAALGALCIAVTLGNESWMTLSSFTSDQRIRHSGGWPDTRTIAIVTSAFTVVLGAMIARRRSPLPLPRATLRR